VACTGVVSPTPQILPLYVDVDVEIAEGLNTTRSDELSCSASDHQWSSTADQWSALQDMYTRCVAVADLAAITGCDGEFMHLNGCRRGSMVRTSAFGWRTFPDLRL